MGNTSSAIVPGWPALVGHGVALQLRTPHLVSVEITDKDRRNLISLELPAFWARVVGVDRAGIWVELWTQVVELSKNKRKTTELYRHFVPFANIVSACTRSPEVFGDPKPITVKAPGPGKGADMQSDSS